LFGKEPQVVQLFGSKGAFIHDCVPPFVDSLMLIITDIRWDNKRITRKFYVTQTHASGSNFLRVWYPVPVGIKRQKSMDGSFHNV
jgi:hypothetical protein